MTLHAYCYYCNAYSNAWYKVYFNIYVYPHHQVNVPVKLNFQVNLNNTKNT